MRSMSRLQRSLVRVLDVQSTSARCLNHDAARRFRNVLQRSNDQLQHSRETGTKSAPQKDDLAPTEAATRCAKPKTQSAQSTQHNMRQSDASSHRAGGPCALAQAHSPTAAALRSPMATDASRAFTQALVTRCTEAANQIAARNASGAAATVHFGAGLAGMVTIQIKRVGPRWQLDLSRCPSALQSRLHCDLPALRHAFRQHGLGAVVLQT